MAGDKWYNEDTMPTIGTELFRSTRRFKLWEQSLTHGQLLLRCAPDWGSQDTRIDLLFKPVEMMQLHTLYDGLVVRLAGQDIPWYRFEVESGDSRDFVVAYAFGWHEDNGAAMDPSAFDLGIEPFRRPEARTPAPLDDLIAALQAGEQPTPQRDKFRYIHVLMLRTRNRTAWALRAYLTKGEAEDAMELRRSAVSPRIQADEELWIDTIPIEL